MFNQIVIIGGGKSINEGLEMGLYSRLNKTLTIGCNYAYKFFKPTVNAIVDIDTYEKNRNTLQHTLTTCHYANLDEPQRFPEAYWLPSTKDYANIKDSGKVYNPILVGIWAISLAIHLIKNSGTIYLLGYDWTKRKEGNTHFYQGQIEHNGINKTDFYDMQNPDTWFKPFLNEKFVNIYNVNPNSNINTFKKINYGTLLCDIKDEPYSQDYLREYIKAKLEPIRIK